MNQRVRRSGTFSQTREGIVQSNHLIVGLLVLACLILSALWFFFVSGYWSIQKIETNPLVDLKGGEVASTTFAIIDSGSWKPWDRRNIFFIDPIVLANQLRDQLFAESVSVDKVYPDVLRLKITERQRSVVVASQDQLLIVDTNGLVTGEATTTTVGLSKALLLGQSLAAADGLPVIECGLPELATAGYQAAKPEDVKAWIEAYKAFTAAGVKFRYFKLTDPDAQELDVQTDQAYVAIFDLGSDLMPQIDTYKKFLDSKPKNMVPHEYV
ncbi:MAG: hypothetical protein WA001_01555, partial [Patescibacteria group bacterium]